MADLDLDLDLEPPPPPPSSNSFSSSLLMKALSKRRTWVALFLTVYALLLSSSWNILLAIHSWYNSATTALSVLYASLLYGCVFGILAMGAALSVALPAMVVTWIAVLVLLAFAGKPRTQLVMEGRRVTADIVSTAVRILIKEGNLVAALCAVVSFVVLMRRRRRGAAEQQQGNADL